MESAAPSLEAEVLQRLRQHLVGERSADVEVLIEAIRSEHLEEEAEECLRTSRREPEHRARAEALALNLRPLADRAQKRREAFWQMDSRRTLVRFVYAKAGTATDFDDGDLQAIFLRAFRLEGLQVALDLGKRPRPMLGGGLPLPAGVGGLAERIDTVLKREPAGEPGTWMARLNQRLPLGLSLHGWQNLPLHASPLNDLALRSHWRWPAPPELFTEAHRKVAAFLGSAQWLWDRGPAKAAEKLNLRELISDMAWEGGALCFTSAMADHQALNPMKMLGAILGLEPSRITGLVRNRVELKEDPRLGQGDRYEPKLKNMYEDAVLLAGGSNITLVDDDDDEPIRLG
jgi:radical SAM-linked protein